MIKAEGETKEDIDKYLDLNVTKEGIDIRGANGRIWIIKTPLEKIFGKSDQIGKIIKQVQQVAHSDFSVIIEGETGVGKSLVARTIHSLSHRRGKPFVKADIGAIPETLFESELFGYKKGAFTGADRDKKGLFEEANGGTLFLDELQNLTPYAQSKLLGVVEEREVIPLGSTTPIGIDVRIISATNKNIRKEVRSKKFREDLFFRLCEFDIHVPPLRKRSEDIIFLAQRFFNEAVSELGKNIKEISPDALAILKQHCWEGNVRELKNIIRKSVLLCETERLTPGDISIIINCESNETPKIYENNGSIPFTLRIDELEKWALRQAIIKTNGKLMKAADVVGIEYQKFKRKLKKYGINP